MDCKDYEVCWSLIKKLVFSGRISERVNRISESSVSEQLWSIYSHKELWQLQNKLPGIHRPRTGVDHITLILVDCFDDGWWSLAVCFRSRVSSFEFPSRCCCDSLVHLFRSSKNEYRAALELLLESKFSFFFFISSAWLKLVKICLRVRAEDLI